MVGTEQSLETRFDRRYQALPVRRRRRTSCREVDVRLAETADECKAATQLVHREYYKRGYAGPPADGLRVSIFHALPETVTVVAVHRTRGVIGTVSLIPDSLLGVPMDVAYRPELDALRRQGQQLAEASLFALDRSAAQGGRASGLRAGTLALTMRMFKTLFDHLRARTQTTELIACCHPRHRALYTFLRMEPLAGVRTYDAVKGHPAMAWHLNIAEGGRRAATDPVLRLFYGAPLQPAPLARPRMFSLEDLRELFARSSSVFATASQTAKTYLQVCYPAYRLGALTTPALAPAFPLA